MAQDSFAAYLMEIYKLELLSANKYAKCISYLS